jgi:hypothetical protein
MEGGAACANRPSADAKLYLRAQLIVMFACASAVQSLRFPPRSFVVGSFKLSGLLELAPRSFFLFSERANGMALLDARGSARAGSSSG